MVRGARHDLKGFLFLFLLGGYHHGPWSTAGNNCTRKIKSMVRFLSVHKGTPAGCWSCVESSAVVLVIGGEKGW